MNTSIEDLLTQFNEYHEEEENEHSEKEPCDAVFDFSLSQEERVNALNIYYQSNPEDIVEIISKLNAIYCMSPIGLMRKFIYEVSMCSSLPLELRIECAITLADIESSKELGLKCLDHLVDIIEHQYDIIIPTPCRLEYILKLVNSGLYPNRISALYDFVCDQNLSNEYRYRTVLLLENNVQLNGFETMIEACKQFSMNVLNAITFRILACQNILVKCKDDILLRDETEQLLISFMTDENLEHNIRADSADVILHFGREETIATAENILRDLGGRDVASIYENKENAHIASIEFSVMETIRYLDTLNLSPIPTFDTVSYNIQQTMKKMYSVEEITKKEENVKNALLRIELDRTLFAGVNHTLQSILLHLYVYIQSHDARRELEKRLVEELVDMSGTCSTGFIGRLVNTLSGFGEHSLSISWEDQIVGNLAGRLNAKMKDDPNMDEIVQQMVNKDIGDRSAFLKFFRENISQIKEEMYEEFREHMEDCDWDLRFRKAIMNYEK